jgi:FkbM family methyltransferase
VSRKFSTSARMPRSYREGLLEPQSRLQNVLFRNIAENRAFNVHVFQTVISDGVGIATLYLSPDMNTGSSGVFRTSRYRVPTEIVPQTTLDSFLQLLNVSKIKLIKIDIESFEYEAILDAPSVLGSDIIEYIALELHPDILRQRGKSETELLDFLAAHGYTQQKEFGPLVFGKNVIGTILSLSQN